MQISSSSINYSSSQINLSKTTAYERIHAWDKNSDIVSESSEENGRMVLKQFSEKRVTSLQNSSVRYPDYSDIQDISQNDNDSDELSKKLREYAGDIKIQMIKDILEAFTGEKIRLFDPVSLKNDENNHISDNVHQKKNAQTELPENAQIPDWGFEYYFKETSYTAEGFLFEADGVITTSEGDRISFSVSLEMLIENYSENSVSVKSGAALIDPVMIDLSGKGIRFSDALFMFDLDGNGKKELISAPAEETGFLAIDKNGNGIIDDGTELFGPQTGNGFSELAHLDDDSNGWIDENDEVFDKLLIWQKAANGSDKLSSLRDAGISALSVTGIDTQFDVRSGPSMSSENIAAVLKKTGLLIKENKEISFLQEVDFVV